MPSLQLAPHQEEFLNSFLGRNDERTLLVAAPGSGKTVVSNIAAARMLARDLVDRVLFVAGHRVLVDQWQRLLERGDLGDETARESAFAGTTYAALIKDPEGIWTDVPPRTRWLFLFEDVDWAGHRVEAIAADALNRFPDSRALFVASKAPPIAVDTQFTFQFFGRDILAEPDTQSRLQQFAPSVGLLQRVQRKLIELDDLTWREFEHLIAKMLEADGYNVELMQGSKDGGIDVVAIKNLGDAGLFKSVWQAKKHRLDRKAGLSLVRELADTRLEHKASKGIIVTTSFLTSGALERVERDRYLLGKVDRADLDQWIERTLRPET
jgi:HJR/Mrr/RecB family endonuclease